MDQADGQKIGRLFILYSQIALFQEDMESPFNDWCDEHVEQGFSWRENSVSFSALEDGVTGDVYFTIAENYLVRDDASRAIIVPFVVEDNNGIEIATITESLHCRVKAGKYNVLFQAGCPGDGEYWYSFTFVPSEERLFQIVKNDGEITRTDNFNLVTFPA